MERDISLVHRFDGSPSRHREGATLCVRCSEDRNYWWHDGWLLVASIHLLIEGGMTP